MNKFLSMGVGLVLLGSAVAAEAADAITGNVTLASDYRFRGISQVEGGFSPAIQGGFDWKPEIGFYLGTWASNVNFSGVENASIETDLYGGFSRALNDKITYDVGFYYYGYPHATFRPRFGCEGPCPNVQIDYYEYYGSLSFTTPIGGVKTGVNYSPDYFAETGDFFYPYIEYSTKIADKLTILAHYGYNKFDQKRFLGNRDYYSDWKVAASIDGFGVTWGLAYVATNLDSNEECFGDEDLCKATAVFSISKAL